jgi:uncharacterized protein YdeI (BOF family)
MSTMRIHSSKTGRAFTAGLPSLVFALVAWSPVAIAEEPNPFLMADDSWITISGTVESVSADSFTLDYGDGAVIVEMDDGDRDADAYKLMVGDKVTVSGEIDDDFYETTTIEASSVYVENLGTTFFASAVDEETTEGWAVAVTVPIPISQTIVYGTVTDVDEHEFTVDSGLRELQVDVADMPYNPLDDEGYQKIRVGDRVKVSGDIDTDFFEGRELMADAVIKLNMS